MLAIDVVMDVVAIDIERRVRWVVWDEMRV
jgi:hypothetical protein